MLAQKIVSGNATSTTESASGSEMVMPSMTTQEIQTEIDPTQQQIAQPTIQQESHENGRVDNNLKHHLLSRFFGRCSQLLFSRR